MTEELIGVIPYLRTGDINNPQLFHLVLTNYRLIGLRITGTETVDPDQELEETDNQSEETGHKTTTDHKVLQQLWAISSKAAASEKRYRGLNFDAIAKSNPRNFIIERELITKVYLNPRSLEPSESDLTEDKLYRLSVYWSAGRLVYKSTNESIPQENTKILLEEALGPLLQL